MWHPFSRYYVDRWMSNRENLHAVQKISWLFWESLEKMLKWMDEERYFYAYSAGHSGCRIHFPTLYAGPVQNSSILNLGAMDVRYHFQLQRRVLEKRILGGLEDGKRRFAWLPGMFEQGELRTDQVGINDWTWEGMWWILVEEVRWAGGSLRMIKGRIEKQSSYALVTAQHCWRRWEGIKDKLRECKSLVESSKCI